MQIAKNTTPFVKGRDVMDVIKLLKLVGCIATAVSTASNLILKPRLDAMKDDQMRTLIEQAVANAMNQEKGP